MEGLIVGAGNAGLSYLKSAKALNHSIDLCENNVERQGYILDMYPDLNILTNTQDAEKNYDYIIIATTAKSHLKISKQLIRLGPKTLVIEKLISNNLRDLDEFMLLQAAHPKTLFTSHNRWSLLGVDQEIDKLKTKHLLGNFVSFHSIGGAMCLATGAIHWIASFYDFFGLTCEYDLSGSIQAYPQTYRAELDVIHGSFEVRYKLKSLNFHYYKDCKITPYQTFLFEYGAVMMNFDGEYQVILCESSNGASFKRYESGKVIERGNIMHGGDNPFINLIEEISENKVSATGFFNTVKANQLILSAMQLTGKNYVSYSELELNKSNPIMHNFDWRIS
jgi:hypothetical protein